MVLYHLLSTGILPKKTQLSWKSTHRWRRTPKHEKTRSKFQSNLQPSEVGRKSCERGGVWVGGQKTDLSKHIFKKSYFCSQLSFFFLSNDIKTNKKNVMQFISHHVIFWILALTTATVKSFPEEGKLWLQSHTLCVCVCDCTHKQIKIME